MRIKGKLFSCIMMIVLLSGCASYSDSTQSWVGLKQSELIEVWGEPDRVIANDPAGTILIYTQEGDTSRVPADDLYRYGSGTKTSDIPGDAAGEKNIYMFWMDNKGIIYRWTEEK